MKIARHFLRQFFFFALALAFAYSRPQNVTDFKTKKCFMFLSHFNYSHLKKTLLSDFIIYLFLGQFKKNSAFNKTTKKFNFECVSKLMSSTNN